MAAQADDKIASYYNKSSTDEHYSTLWGEGNIHFGYFGDDIDAVLAAWRRDPQSAQMPSYPTAAARSSERLMTFGGINAESTVLDLGTWPYLALFCLSYSLSLSLDQAVATAKRRCLCVSAGAAPLCWAWT